MYILGLNAFHADSSAALLKDGKLIVATEEERFTRIKHWAGLPVQAIQFCLREEGLQLKDIEYITIGRDPKAKLFNKFSFLLRNPSLVFNVGERLKNQSSVADLKSQLYAIDKSLEVDTIKKRLMNIRKLLCFFLGNI